MGPAVLLLLAAEQAGCVGPAPSATSGAAEIDGSPSARDGTTTSHDVPTESLVDAPVTSQPSDANINIDMTGRSAYSLLIEVDGEVFDIGLRDLTDALGHFAYGSSHIAPAVSFAMTDSLTTPRTISFTMDLGIIVASDQRPVATEGTGTHQLSTENPSLTLFIKGVTYRSTNAGARGEIVIDDWSTVTGGVIAGSYDALLIGDGDPSLSTAISGMFHFVLPPMPPND